MPDGRPPRAKTWMQASAASESERFSPSLRAISAIERSITMVETAQDTGIDEVWMLPDDVVVVDELPHTATGKVMKTRLRELYAGSAAAQT